MKIHRVLLVVLIGLSVYGTLRLAQDVVHLLSQKTVNTVTITPTLPNLPATIPPDFATRQAWFELLKQPLPSQYHLTQNTYELHRSNTDQQWWEPIAGDAIPSLTTPNYNNQVVAFIKDKTTNYQLTLLNQDTTATYFNIDNIFQSQKGLSVDIDRIIWSPNRKYVVLVTQESQTYTYHIYGFDGTVVPSIGQYTYEQKQDVPLAWSTDGNALHFATRIPNQNTYHFHTYDLQTKTSTEFIPSQQLTEYLFMFFQGIR